MVRLPDYENGRPWQGDRVSSTAIVDRTSLPPKAIPPRGMTRAPHLLADVDALAEHLSGRFVVQVVVDVELGHRRTHVYRSCAAAERAVARATARGQRAHVTLVQMMTVGVVSVGGVQ